VILLALPYYFLLVYGYYYNYIKTGYLTAGNVSKTK